MSQPEEAGFMADANCKRAFDEFVARLHGYHYPAIFLFLPHNSAEAFVTGPRRAFEDHQTFEDALKAALRRAKATVGKNSVASNTTEQKKRDKNARLTRAAYDEFRAAIARFHAATGREYTTIIIIEHWTEPLLIARNGDIHGYRSMTPEQVFCAAIAARQRS
ncbi:MAG: hypothetical protein WCT32_05820 [Patescibacteria group bacterium]